MIETNHYKNEREYRANFIANVIGDTNNVICVNVKDRKHKDGLERFELTDKAIIHIYNHYTNRHITDIVARPNQIYDRLGSEFKTLPIKVQQEIIRLSKEHIRKGYNLI